MSWVGVRLRLNGYFRLRCDGLIGVERTRRDGRVNDRYSLEPVIALILGRAAGEGRARPVASTCGSETQAEWHCEALAACVAERGYDWRRRSMPNQKRRMPG